MIIRSASFRDLARIEQLYREATEDERHGAQMTPDSPVPQATLLRLWQALTKSLSSLVPITDVSEEMLVAEDAKEGVVGFVQVQSLSVRPRSWQILNLCTSTTAHGHFARAELLDGVRNRGLEHGVQRVHVRLPLDHPLLPVFLEHGFTQFATEQILYRDQAAAEPEQSVRSTLIRPARRDDIGAIYLLYLRTTPSQVAAVEGPSLKTWQAGYAQGLDRRARLVTTCATCVVERPGIVAWAAIRPPTAAQPAEPQHDVRGTRSRVARRDHRCSARGTAVRTGLLRAPSLRLRADPGAAAARVRRLRHAAPAHQRARREGPHQRAVAAQEARPGACRRRSKRPLAVTVGATPCAVNDHDEEREIVAQMMPYGSSWEEELNLLFAALPPRIAAAAQRLSQGRGDLLEIVLDLGREPEARFTDGEAILD